MYAIIETGGKQFKVSVGDVIHVEKLGVPVGAYTLDKVLAVVDGGKTNFGAPYLKATVSAEVLGDGKEKKVIVYKYKSKKTFHKKKGHRQPYTELKITAINA
ncbi:50S ribosomal protein L21 [Clostridia bacterium]|nr:50S ribosomal protein L21 [Clostridia bacterium]